MEHLINQLQDTLELIDKVEKIFRKKKQLLLIGCTNISLDSQDGVTWVFTDFWVNTLCYQSFTNVNGDYNVESSDPLPEWLTQSEINTLFQLCKCNIMEGKVNTDFYITPSTLRENIKDIKRIFSLYTKL